jgi:chromosome partitioning protein
MKKPTVIAVICHKGGVGKTSSTVSLADALVASNPGKRVLIVDADEQSNVKTIFAIKMHEAEGGLASVLLDNASPNNVKVTVRPQIDVILSGGRRMREFERTHANTPNAELMMKLRFENLTDYDFVIIDSPPALSLISSNIVTYADYLVLPSSPDLLAVVGVKNTLYFIENMKEVFKRANVAVADVLGILPTMYDQRRNLDMSIVDDFQRMADNNLTLGGRVFSPIRTDIKVKTAQIKRKLLSEAFASSKAAEDYRKLAQEVLEDIESREAAKKSGKGLTPPRREMDVPGANASL